MKSLLIMLAATSLGLTGCDTMNRPISSGNFDPLSTPGGGTSTPSAATPAFTAGQFVRAIMDNTAFFNNRPKGNADADKLLARGTSMKVISSSGSYVKVELDSGEVGWVPTLMVESPNASTPLNDGFDSPNPGEYQVYPPTGGYSGEFSAVAPAELPPEGAIPTVIDPEAPSAPEPVPPVTIPDDAFPADEQDGSQ
jgi:hypothetical protein